MSTKQNNQSNPFQFATEANDSKSRKLAYTSILMDTANRRAHEVMTEKCNTPELKELANTMMDGDPNILVQLLTEIYGETIKTDADILDGCDEDQLKKMMESRRSDRSTSKRKGIRTSAVNCRSYISAMYAELMIREQLHTPYTGSFAGSSELDETDLEAVGRRIKSLQSKKCRLKKLADYDEDAATELSETEAEIERLSALRPTTRVAGKTVIKDLKLDELRDMLKTIDPETLPESERDKLVDLMQKIG